MPSSASVSASRSLAMARADVVCSVDLRASAAAASACVAASSADRVASVALLRSSSAARAVRQRIQRELWRHPTKKRWTASSASLALELRTPRAKLLPASTLSPRGLELFQLALDHAQRFVEVADGGATERAQQASRFRYSLLDGHPLAREPITIPTQGADLRVDAGGLDAQLGQLERCLSRASRCARSVSARWAVAIASAADSSSAALSARGPCRRRAPDRSTSLCC